jgi:hypothetical protein
MTSSPPTPLHDEYLLRAKAVREAELRSMEMEREFIAGKVLNAQANEALTDYRRKQEDFAWWLVKAHHALFMQSETAQRNAVPQAGSSYTPQGEHRTETETGATPAVAAPSRGDKQDEGRRAAAQEALEGQPAYLGGAPVTPSHVAQRKPERTPGWVEVAANLPLNWNHFPADALEGWEMLTRAYARYRQLERELAEANRDVTNLHECLRQAALQEDLTPSASGAVEALRECRAYFERELADDQTLIDGDFGTAYRLTVAALAAAESRTKETP